ncbi:helix-turn-helix transcriptional regulator [Quadrisphaera setariae]|uniref:Helix-turn-helix transcriptional regulator n=1 Tax=Quadrisphaera setariae TaxID=2593304 RepID=A0A5C8ZF45_9ACTN|nr:LuxR family transcriptional regulator [Quadrisphaera setariae]TXR56094.1 helix-turn-helix transcriptional regulator [Quadrisphaera setariae]
MLLGRQSQKQTLVTALSRGSAGRGGSILLTGSPGSGFTALLDEVVAAAHGLGDPLVLTTTGVEDEAGMPYALLHQVICPLLAELGDDLDLTRRESLEAVVGARAPQEGAVPVALAALGALELLARRRPVLVVVDDAHLADPDSASVLRFLGRRLSRTAACLLVVHPEPVVGAPSAASAEAARTGADAVVVLEPLGARDARAWADREQPWLDPVQRDTVLHLAAGRPRRLADLLHLVDREAVASAPDGGIRTALRGSVLPAVAAARRDLEAVDHRTRRALVALGLLDDPAGAWLVARVAGGEGAGPGVHAPAAADPLTAVLAAVEADPLLVTELRTAWSQHLEEAAAAALAGGPAATRLRAEALRQRALADPAGAPALAAPLEDAARALCAVDAARSSELFALAAEHHREVPARAAAASRAAELALACGRHDRARLLAERAAALTDGAGAAAAAVTSRWSALTALARGDRDAAALHLEHHLGRQVGAPGVDQELLATAAALVMVAGRRTGGCRALEAAASATPALAGPLRSLARLALPWHLAVPDEQRHSLDDALAALAGAGLPVLRLAADAGRLLGRSDEVAAACRSSLPAWPTTGPAAVDVHLALAACALDTGDLTEVRAHVQDARAALRHAPQAEAAVLQAEQLVACLGSTRVPDAAWEDASDLPPTTERAGAVWCRAHRHRLRGDLASAAAELLPLWPADEAPADAGALLNALPTVHALSGSGAAPEVLERTVRQVTAWAEGSGAPLAVSTALVCRAVLVQDPHAQQQLLREAVERGGDGPAGAAPRLALGMLLRRARQAVAAREPLGAALRVFERHGLAAFAELARRELDATAPLRPARPMGSSVLTGQERTVATLAAEGLSNAGIAQSLGISARTVAHHLQHVYAKLGVSGRQELGPRLEER